MKLLIKKYLKKHGLVLCRKIQFGANNNFVRYEEIDL